MSDTNTAKQSLRDIKLARAAEWAKNEGLHTVAIDLAGKYINLDQNRLKLISAYHVAHDMYPGPARETAMADAWNAVITYLRSVPLGD